MFKNINKFSKLAILFTVFYILVGQFIMSDIYSSIPNFLFWVVYSIYLGCMVASVIIGIIAVIQANKAKESGKWVLLLLTLFNIFVLVLNTITVVIFPIEESL